MIDVYYPYINGKEAWQELRYSLRSVDENLKTPHRIVICGDLPHWVRNVKHIPVKPIVKGEENCLRDTLNKLNTYIGTDDAAGSFLRMYDDVYLINSVYISDFRFPLGMYPVKDIPPIDSLWFNQLRRTAKILGDKNSWNTETHYPELYDTSRMRALFDRYNPLEKKLLIGMLYNNNYFAPNEIVPEDKHHGVGAKFYGQNAVNDYNFSPFDDVHKVCSGKLFLNHNNSGLSDAIKNFLTKKFPNPCRYEI